MTDLPPLPSSVSTLGGVEFDPRQDVWAYTDEGTPVHLNFSRIMSYMSPKLLHAAKLVFIQIAEDNKPDSLRNQFDRLRALLVWRSRHVTEERLSRWSAALLLSYKASLSRETEWYLATVRGFLKRWAELGYPGVPVGVLKVLAAMRLAGNVHGEAVLTMDPHGGPFTNIEFEGLRDALDDGLATGVTTQEGTLLGHLFCAFGSRPKQFAALKVKDVKEHKNADGSVHYTVDIPRAKQRGKPIREEFTERPLERALGEALHAHALEQRTRFQNIIPDAGEAPLFAQSDSKQDSEEFAHHHSAQSITRLLLGTCAKLDLRSERTGEILHVSPIRFRYTLGTRAAQEGHGTLVIAQLLDHSDTQHVQVYVLFTPEIAVRINRAVAWKLAPLAQAFKGIVIRSEAEAKRAGDPEALIADPSIDQSGKDLGSCGKFSFCGRWAPIACYTCMYFEAWIDGPHEAVLKFLESERERQFSRDKRIASVNDRTILAVISAIQQCKALLSGTASTATQGGVQ